MREPKSLVLPLHYRVVVGAIAWKPIIPLLGAFAKRESVADRDCCDTVGSLDGTYRGQLELLTAATTCPSAAEG